MVDKLRKILIEILSAVLKESEERVEERLFLKPEIPMPYL